VILSGDSASSQIEFTKTSSTAAMNTKFSPNLFNDAEKKSVTWATNIFETDTLKDKDKSNFAAIEGLNHNDCTDDDSSEL